MSSRISTCTVSAFLIAGLLVACGSPVTAPIDASTLATGNWRATLSLPSGELPVTMQIETENGSPVAYFVNGRDRMRASEVRFENRTLTIRMPGFENTLTAKLQAGELVGEVLMIKDGAKQQHVPFHAKPNQTWRFFETPDTKPIDVSGRWAVEFNDAGKKSIAVAEFSQTGAEVTGTFLTPTGDHRYLAGEVRAQVLSLSVFDGGHAFLYRATLGANGELAGDFWSGLKHHETWTAHRDANASLGASESATAMRDQQTRLDFTFPDLDGKPVSLSDPAYRGKVVIVALAGSWCPNCHDEAAFLADMHRRLRARGLEVVSLMFEQFGDFPQAVDATRRFRKEFGIEYTTLIAGISDKDDAATRLPQLNKIYAFPTTLFIDRKGQVRRIHTGFSGPATGDHYRKLAEEFTTTVDALLKEDGGA